MKRILVLILIITFAFSTILLAQPKLQKVDKREKVLVVLLDGKPSLFKQSVIDSLGTIYNIHSIQANNPKEVRANEYKAVVVMDKLKAWMWFNGKLKRFTKAMDPKHTVYFVTSGDANWKWKKQGINAVTSASKNGNVGEVVKKIRLKIEE